MGDPTEIIRAAQRDLIRLSRDLRTVAPGAVIPLASAYAELDRVLREDT